MPAAMNSQATLSLSCLGFHEPHVRPANGLADCLCVSGIVLLPLHVGLQRDQPPWGDEAHRMVSTAEDWKGPSLLDDSNDSRPTISTFIPSMLATLLLLLMTSPPTLWLGEQRL